MNIIKLFCCSRCQSLRTPITEPLLSTNVRLRSGNQRENVLPTSCYSQPSLEENTIILLFDEVNVMPVSSLRDHIQGTTGLCGQNCADVQEVAEYLKKRKHQSITVATTNSEHVDQLLAICGEQQAQLTAVYVLDSSMKSIVYDRRVQYFANMTTLLQQIKLDMRPSLNQEPLAFSFFDRNQKTVRDLSKESASFMWTQILIDVLKQFPSDKKAMEDMLLMCQKCYHDNPVQLRWIKQFSDTYESRDAIRWYTKDCFLYRLLNKALRTEDTDALYLFRAFIVDLCMQLEEQKRLYSCSPPISTVYRGQTMFEWELKKLIANIGQLISANAFFSASHNQDVAEMFAGRDPSDSHEKSVLLQIEIDSRLQHTIVAPIAHLSEIPLENEVLFSLSTVFKILDVREESYNNRWRVYLQATDEGQEVVDEYRHISSADDECPTTEIVFGRLLISMDQCAKAFNYLTSLANQPNTASAQDVISYAAIVCSQSECLHHMGKYEKAQEYAEKGIVTLGNLGMSSTSILYLRCRYHLANALLLTNNVQQARCILEEILGEQQNRLPEYHVHIADTFRAIGYMIGVETGYDKALKFRQEALKIYEKALPQNHLKCIHATISLAGSYEAVGQYHVALDYLNCALQMQERYLPDEHSSHAVTFRSLGIIYQILDERDKAFDYYCRAYSIWMRQYPQGHNYAAFCLNRIGEVYCAQKQLPEALQCQLQALEMRTKLYKKNTPQPLHSLGRTYLDMGENAKAIETIQLACKFWEVKSTDPSNKYLNAIESLLATAHSHNGEFAKAHDMFERVLSLQENAHPEGNPDIGYTLHHMASNLIRMNKYNRAMRCYKASLTILLKVFPERHCEVVTVREKMATLETVIKKLHQN